MTKAKEQEIEGTIVITKFSDPTLPFKIIMTGDWTPRQLMAIHPLVVKANRERLTLLKAQMSKANEGDEK